MKGNDRKEQKGMKKSREKVNKIKKGTNTIRNKYLETFGSISLKKRINK